MVYKMFMNSFEFNSEDLVVVHNNPQGTEQTWHAQFILGAAR